MKSAAIKFLLVSNLVLIKVLSQETPCPNIFKYRSNIGTPHGIIEVPNSEAAVGKVVLVAKFSITGSRPKDPGSIDYIKGSKPLMYRVRFPYGIFLAPRVTEIIYNGSLICSGPNYRDLLYSYTPIDVFQLVSNITIEPNYASPILEVTQPPLTSTTLRILQQLRIDNSNVQGKNVNTNDICGTRDAATPLIYGGIETRRGNWPWVIAIYIKNQTNLKFICGGSLINNRDIVTAAHCMRVGSRDRQPSDVLLMLGGHNLNERGVEGTVESNVQQIVIHPDYQRYSKQSFDADIAILIMDRQISYTQYIRPICLWPATSGIQDVEGSSGTVVGWGKNEFDVVSEFPKKIDLPIVNVVKCLQTSSSLIGLISTRTFCAGALSGDRPCHGDSGAGLIIYRNDRWMLRGIVSAGISDPDTGRCILTDYSVFTDVSLFTSWIQLYI